jgi:site-specific DNA-methyltransferase (adenine-specific)
LRKHENVMVFYEHLPTYNLQYTHGNAYKTKRNKPNLESCYGKTGTKNGYISVNTGVRYPVSVLNISEETNPDHPTQKPVSLFSYLIRTYTNEGDTVLDNCAGSGTCGVACINTNRNFILIEQLPEYVDIANRRIKEARSQLRMELTL